MIEKLLALFIHAKTGAISGVLLLGASGALITATSDNGVTTITVTQASPTPSASASSSASPSPSPRALSSPSPTPSASPSATAALSLTVSTSTPQACAAAVRIVNKAFHDSHGAVAKMRSDGNERGTHDKRASTATTATTQTLTAKQADDLLKGIRKAAVKAIHASCLPSRDEEDEDRNEGDGDDEDASAGRTTGPTSALLFTGTPAEMAKQATAAMDLVIQALRAQVSTTTATTTAGDDDDDHDRKTTSRSKSKSENKNKEQKRGRD